MLPPPFAPLTAVEAILESSLFFFFSFAGGEVADFCFFCFPPSCVLGLLNGSTLAGTEEEGVCRVEEEDGWPALLRPEDEAGPKGSLPSPQLVARDLELVFDLVFLFGERKSVKYC